MVVSERGLVHKFADRSREDELHETHAKSDDGCLDKSGIG